MRTFPIMGGPAIPWALIEPHERQAQRNHSQSLERLAERGGLSPCEALAVLEDRDWWSMPADTALREFKALVDADLRGQLAAATTRAEAAEAALAIAQRELKLERELEPIAEQLTQNEVERQLRAALALQAQELEQIKSDEIRVAIAVVTQIAREKMQHFHEGTGRCTYDECVSASCLAVKQLDALMALRPSAAAPVKED